MEPWEIEEQAYERAKGGLQAAFRTIYRRMDETGGQSEANQALKRTLESNLQEVHALFQRVIYFDGSAYQPGYELAASVHSEYGGRSP